MLNKKIWLSMGLIGLVAGGAGLATFAYLTAQRTTSTNKFTAGTLDLDVVGDHGSKLEPFVIDNMGDNANISGTKSWTIKNTGSLPGRLLVRLQNVVNKENGCANDQETAAEPDCSDVTKDGELGNVIDLKVGLDSQDLANSTLATAQTAKLGDDWNALTPIVLQPNESRTLNAHWATDETQYGNEVQGDGVQFDMNIRLIQLINGPTPSN
ncbi:MAG: hypothetical protein UT63_C0011G0006 [Candidatus Gottesmanbacteria bacterium GW2011_GWC2_39_8]|uniref:Uncharacterized protein n=1 Tax=Candidatus Gottesmanbacteria bacterium GW2011_GWC2_39_8 TaxID=1618450 RepID=A0A0G0Q0E6_9BACT|nr:MAG: hypothetical protein UT63_C0011G0006 [Candidatus Gottesmanbacteria bacterium GW2011_GWC2_39_8]